MNRLVRVKMAVDEPHKLPDTDWKLYLKDREYDLPADLAWAWINKGMAELVKGKKD